MTCWWPPTPLADWRGVIRLCEALLATQTKDLRVTGWLTEALGRAHGLAGLADGHALTAALCDSFWDDIHPQPEDGELEQRIGALDWLLAQTTRLHRSERTLRRHLQQLNTSFQHLLDEVRYDKARQLLLNTDLPIYLIAEQLGYSETASFRHAFQRWSGLAPSELRR